MSDHRTCSRGHKWQVAEGSAAQVVLCPDCGRPALEADNSAATVLVGLPRFAGKAEPIESPMPGDTLSPIKDFLSATQVEIVLPTVPGYTVLEEVGRGGMGIVYKARQDALGRLVALKTIHASASLYPDIISRFRAEAESIACLHHPNIIQVHEIGSGATGPYLVMEYAEGGTLAQRLGGSPQGARTSAALVRTLARAIHAAHEAGVIHRDIKPGNILLADPPGTPLDQCTPKVSDFGLARRLDEVHGITLSGQVIGTPGYMAPEQAAGVSAEVGPAADIYALGVLLYEMLTSRPPFRGSTAIETVHLMLLHEPMPPTRLRRDVPRDLETICLHCLDRVPGRRYASAAALADDLDRFLGGRPILARPITALEVVWKWSRRQPTTAALAFGFVVLLAISFGLLFRGWRNAEAEQLIRQQERDRANLLADDATAARHNAEQLAVRLILERGATLCESGDHGSGLHWLLHGLQTIPANSSALDISARLLTSGWQGNLHTLEQFYTHPGSVSALTFLGDGKTLAASVGSRVWLHREDSRTEPHSLPGEVLYLATTTAGTFAVTATDKHEVHVCALASGKPVGPSIKLLAHPRCAAVSRDGSTLLVGLDDRTAWVYRLQTGLAVAGPLPHQGAVLAAAFSPDGQKMLTGGDDYRVRLWSTGGNLLRVFDDHQGPVEGVAFSPDGRRVISIGKDRRVVIRPAKMSSMRVEIPHDKYIASLAVHPREPLIATGCNDNIVRLWHLETGKLVAAQTVHSDEVSSIAFSPDGLLMATGSEDRTARVWRLARPTESKARFPHPLAVVSLVTDADAVITCCGDGGIRRWNPAGEQLLLRRHVSPIAMAMHPPSRSLAVGYNDGKLEILDPATGEHRAGPWAHSAAIISVAFSPDGKLVATGHQDPDWVIRIREVATGRVRNELIGHIRKVSSLAFSPDGTLLLSASWDYTARLWDVTTGKPVGEPMRHQDLVQGVAFAPDGKVALTGGDDYTSRLWHVPSGKPRSQPQLHSDKVQAVAFSPTGDFFATGGKGGFVRFWDLTTGRVIGQPLPQPGEIYSLAFSDEGRTLVSGSRSGETRMWAVPDHRGIDLPTLRRLVEVRTGARFSPEEGLIPHDQPTWEGLARDHLMRKKNLATDEHR